MTTFTKTSNLILRGTIAALLGAAAAQIASGGTAFGNILSGAKDMTAAAVDAAAMNPAHMLHMSLFITVALLAAAVLSCMAFKATKKVSSVFRTLSLFGLAVISALGAAGFYATELVVKVTSGAASQAETAAVKPLLESCAKNGYGQGAAAGVFATLGTVMVTAVAAALVIMTITSAVSVLKTVKAACITDAACCAA